MNIISLLKKLDPDCYSRHGEALGVAYRQQIDALCGALGVSQRKRDELESRCAERDKRIAELEELLRSAAEARGE